MFECDCLFTFVTCRAPMLDMHAYIYNIHTIHIKHAPCKGSLGLDVWWRVERAYIYIYINTYMYVCMYVCMYVLFANFMYVYIHTTLVLQVLSCLVA